MRDKKAKPRSRRRAYRKPRRPTKPVISERSRATKGHDKGLAFAPIRGALLAKREEGPLPDFSEVTDARKRAYLVALCTTPSLSDAARIAGISTRTGQHYRLDANDAAFQAALPHALEFGIQRAEAEAWRRGIEGVEEPVYQGGRMVGTIMRKSDLMLIFMLKAAVPAKYRERQELSGPGGGPIEVAPSVPAWMQKLSDDELEVLRTLRLRAAER